jgi:hypothetical protein
VFASYIVFLGQLKKHACPVISIEHFLCQMKSVSMAHWIRA